MATTTTALAPDAGSRWPWVRDLSLVGGATGVGAPLAAMLALHALHEVPFQVYLVAAGVGGLVTGALLGLATPALIRWKLGRMPRIGFVGVGLAIGALWGALVGAIAAVALVGVEHHFTGIWWLSMLFAAPVGALQLAWFWLTSTQRRIRRRPAAPALAAASVLAPLLGLAAFFGVLHSIH